MKLMISALPLLLAGSVISILVFGGLYMGLQMME